MQFEAVLVRSWDPLARQAACPGGRSTSAGRREDYKPGVHTPAARRPASAPHQSTWGHELPRKPGLSRGRWPEQTASYHSSSQREETLEAPHSSTGFCAVCPQGTGDRGDRRPQQVGWSEGQHQTQSAGKLQGQVPEFPSCVFWWTFALEVKDLASPQCPSYL